MEILTKAQSTDGYKNGRFGNHLRQWDRPIDVDDNCLISIRYRGTGSNGPCLYHLTKQRAWQEWLGLTAYNYKENELYVSESAPDDKLTFQGEIIEHPNSGGYSGHFSTSKRPQREALRSYGGHWQGPGAKLMCKQFMDHDSYEDLLTLFDLYPLHVVEFSCFDIRLGNLRRNTIFWEVRKF